VAVETVLAGILIVVGLVGVVVPMLPGLLLVVVGIGVWAVPRGDALGWTVLGVAVAVAALGTVAKYALPGARMRAAGVPGRTLLAGGVLGIVGFFVVPVVGLLLGFVLGVYLAELARLGRNRSGHDASTPHSVRGGRPAPDQGAWPSTRTALAAVGWSLLIELAAGLVATAVWVGALVLA
jgi:uncharacterized protein YqgC (DUF456 family)